VNVDYPDLDRHPLYRKATPLRVVLSAGDTLYLPAYWHHEVQSLPAEEAESESGPKEVGADVWAAPLNIAVNFWFANLTAPIDDRVTLGL
jgi:jumonji domain-containing protein 7